MFRIAQLITVLILFSATVAHAQEQPISPKEIQDTWVGKTLIGTAANGAAVTMKIQADGSASLAAGSTNVAGTWHVSENGYCTTWKTNRGAQEKCFLAVHSGQKIVVSNLDGSLSGYFTDIK